MKQKLWSEAGQKALRELPVEGWAAQRRQDLLMLITTLNAGRLNAEPDGLAHHQRDHCRTLDSVCTTGDCDLKATGGRPSIHHMQCGVR
jgi:hypothetical protein